MDGKVALEEHFSTELNNRNWDAKGEEVRNGKAYAQDVERRLLDPDVCVAEMDRAGIEMCRSQQTRRRQPAAAPRSAVSRRSRSPPELPRCRRNR